MTSTRSFGLAALALLLAAPVLSGPLAAQRGLREVRQWGTSGFSFDYGVPFGVMSNFIDDVGGLDAFMSFDLGRGSPLALRLEGGLLFHHLAFEDHSTSASYIGSFRGGPQITIGPPGFRLYGVLLGGWSYFGTSASSYDCPCDYYNDGSSTLSGDWTMGVETGGGLMFDLGGGNNPTRLDLGVRLVRHENARYLVAGPIENGARTFTQVQAPAEYMLLRLGVTVGLR